MILALILTLVAIVAYRVFRLTRREPAPHSVHPPEGYLFGDPASPTRAERQRLVLGWSESNSREPAGRHADAPASA